MNIFEDFRAKGINPAFHIFNSNGVLYKWSNFQNKYNISNSPFLKFYKYCHIKYDKLKTMMNCGHHFQNIFLGQHLVVVCYHLPLILPFNLLISVQKLMPLLPNLDEMISLIKRASGQMYIYPIEKSLLVHILLCISLQNL